MSAAPHSAAARTAGDAAPLSASRIALCVGDVRLADAWLRSLRAALPQADLALWPEASPQADCAVVWGPTQAFMDAHPGLRLIFNMGAGVDALLRLRLPSQARIVRIEDGGMAVQMADYVCHAVLRHVREFDRYATQAQARQWAPRAMRRRQDFPVGVMGMGMLGARVVQALRQFDFAVNGWSRSPRTVDGVQGFAGTEQLDDFLAASRILVCMLPLTPDTQDILNRRTLSRLQAGAYVINVARGAHLVEADLLALMDSGQVAGATLDVMRTEPLPADHPFWTDPRIVLTPHVSAQTDVELSIAQIAQKLQAWQRGEAVAGLVDVSRGY